MGLGAIYNRKLLETCKHQPAGCPRQRHHFVGALGRAADAQAGVAALHQAAGDGVKNFIEDGVADGLGPGMRDERQRQPLAQHRQVPGPENSQRHISHGLDVGGDKGRVITRAGPVGAGNENQKGLGHF